MKAPEVTQVADIMVVSSALVYLNLISQIQHKINLPLAALLYPRSGIDFEKE